MTPTPPTLPPIPRHRSPRGLLRATVIGVIGLLLTAVGFIVQPRQTLAAWIVAFCFWLTIVLGCLFWVLAFQASAARWPVVVRRFLEAGAGTIVLFLFFLVPVVLGARLLYPWAGALPPDAPAAVTRALDFRRGIMNVPAFTTRALVFFAIWGVLANLMLVGSRKLDDQADPHLPRLLRRVAAIGLPFAGVSLTFASFDWFMSIEPIWYSSIYGVYLFAGGFLTAMAALILVVGRALRDGAIPPVVNSAHLHSMGKLLLAFVCFWAYIAFSQLLLQWLADLPEETGFYARRLQGAWAPVSAFLVVGHFLLPLVLLLSRARKLSIARLAPVAAWLVFCHWVDVYWLLRPTLEVRPLLHWQDITATIGIGGTTFALALLRVRDRHLVPVGDPLLPASLEYHR